MTANSPGQPCGRAAVAIVVLNHNGKDLLLQCLQTIDAVDYRPLHSVVVDDGSTDGSADLVAGIGVLARAFPGHPQTAEVIRLAAQSGDPELIGARKGGPRT